MLHSNAESTKPKENKKQNPNPNPNHIMDKCKVWRRAGQASQEEGFLQGGSNEVFCLGPNKNQVNHYLHGINSSALKYMCLSSSRDKGNSGWKQMLLHGGKLADQAHLDHF